MSGAPRSLDELLAALSRELRGCPRRQRRQALAEARDHVLSFVEDERAAGRSEQAAEQTAVAAFGDPALVASGVRAVAPRRRLAGALAAVAACVALLVLTPPSLVERHLQAGEVEAAAPPRVIQHASRDGFSVTVRRDQSVVISALASAPAARRLAGTNANPGCIKLLGDGSPSWFAVGSGFGLPFALRIEMRFGAHQPIGFHAPFDACFIDDDFGHSWSTLAAARWPVLVPLTPAGRRWAAEYPIVRDLHLLDRNARLRSVLRAVPPKAASVVSAALGARFQALTHESDLPRPGRIGYWTDGATRVVLSERTPLGRRLYIAYDKGRPAPNDLAQVDTGSGPPPQVVPATTPYTPPAGTPAAQLAVLREPARASDQLPAYIWRAVQMGESTGPRSLFDRARRVLDVPGAGLHRRRLVGYLWPRRDGSVCYEIDFGGGCLAKFPPAGVDPSRTWVRFAGSRMSGVISDTVSSISVERADGTRTRALLGRNAYATRFARSRITALIITHHDGTTTRLRQPPIRLPEGAPRGSPLVANAHAS